MSITYNTQAERRHLIAPLMSIWQESVRASHKFLSESDIVKLVPYVEETIQQVETLITAMDNLTIAGFMGIEQSKIEMLFIKPQYFGQGIGSQLVRMAIAYYDVEFVDCNEQNPSAVKFYEHLGFKTFERTDFDEQGNPFPILKMKLEVI